MKRNILKKTAVSLTVLAVVMLTGCGTNDDLIHVKTAEVSKGQIETLFTVTGALVPAQTADVSTTLTGKVAEVNVEVGDTVAEGQILAKLDDSQLAAQYSQAEATYEGSRQSLRQAKINMDNALATLERTKSLYNEGAVAKVQLDADQKAYDLAKSQYEGIAASGTGAAKATVDAAGVQLNNTVIKSPIPGIVLNKNITVGETAATGSTLVTVADMSVLKLRGTIPQDALPYIKKDDTVEIFIDIYPDRNLQGKITDIGSMSVSTGTYFPIEISMENGEQYPSGISAHADIKARGGQHLLVPASAVVENNGENYLFVIEDGVAKKTTVVTGLKNDDEIEIIKGLKGGEQVAASNANHLFDEMPVQIVKD